jgi:hypothetical protein
MARNANNAPAPTGNKVEQKALDGAFPARIVQIVFLGVQEQRAYQGQPKPPCDSVRITYELSHEFMADEEGNEVEDKPRWESETIPFKAASLDLATSTKRFKAYRPGVTSLNEYVWDSTLLGTAVQLTMKSRTVKEGAHAGRTFNDVKGVTPAANMPGYTQPDLVNPALFFDPEDDAVDAAVFNDLPQWLQDEIKKANNYQGMPLYTALKGGTAPEKADKAPEAVPEAPLTEGGKDADNPY